MREFIAITFFKVRFLRVWSALKAKVYVVSENRHRARKVTICVRRYPFFESRPQRFTFSRSKLRRSDNNADRHYEKILWDYFHLSLSSWFQWKWIVPPADFCASLLRSMNSPFKCGCRSHDFGIRSALLELPINHKTKWTEVSHHLH